MTQILAISGSLRKQSFNTRLAHEAQRLAASKGISLEVATLHGIPLYDGDLEAAEGSPAAVEALKEKIIASDGVLLVTPEYNNGIPGVFKNAIDWLSRPSGDSQRVFAGKPMAVIGASPGGFGTVMSQAAWLPVLKSLSVSQWSGGSLLLSRAHQAFDADGKLADEATAKRLTDFISGFALFIE